MTTRESMTYRTASVSKDIGAQFARFFGNLNINDKVKPRVDKLRNSRASLYEVMAVGGALEKEYRDLYFPEYQNMVDDFAQRNIDIDSFSAKRRRFVYTNENLYDVFNLATNIASHRREEVGADTCTQLNKIAGEIFTRGPALDFNILDIYQGR